MGNTSKKKTQSPLIGRATKPTTLDNTSRVDVDTKKVLIDNIIEAGISGGLDINALENFTSLSNNRDQIYQLIDTMAQDSSVSSIIRTFAEDVCESSDNGHIVWCESTNPKVSKYVNFMLDMMNVDKNIYSWAYSLIKYGDIYLRLYRESDYDDLLFDSTAVKTRASLNEQYTDDKDINKKLKESVNINIHQDRDPYSYYVEAQPDPGAMFELTKFGKTFGFIEVPVKTLGNLDNYLLANGQQMQSYRMRSSEVNIYQADDYVHACLDDTNNRYPEKVEIYTGEDPDDPNSKGVYTVKRGKSLLIDSYKVWRERSLLENSALLNRVTKSSVVRNIQVEVGDMPKEKVQQTLRGIKDLFEQKASFNKNNSMGEYTNPGPVENNIFTASHKGIGAITINSMGGDVEVKNLGDLDWWNNKFYSSYGIPKQYFGWTEDSTGFNGGTSLSIISAVYCHAVKRVQNALIQAITDAINLFLINKGYRSFINNFKLKMRTPTSQVELDYRNALSNKITAISSAQSLLTDVENKVTRLNIIKTLFAMLDFGDEITQELQNEIDLVKAQQKAEKEKEKEEARKQAELDKLEAANGGSGAEEMPTGGLDLGADLDLNSDNQDMGTEVPADLGDTGADMPAEDIDLNPPAGTDLTPLAVESFAYGDGTLFTEGSEFLTEEDDLPTPETLDKDFTQNK